MPRDVARRGMMRRARVRALQIQAVRGAASPLVPPRYAHGADGCLRSTWSALRAASEDGTGEPATIVIEADVIPTSPGHGDACGALGGL